jgi:hypothetical protein
MSRDRTSNVTENIVGFQFCDRNSQPFETSNKKLKTETMPNDSAFAAGYQNSQLFQKRSYLKKILVLHLITFPMTRNGGKYLYMLQRSLVLMFLQVIGMKITAVHQEVTAVIM